MEIGLTTNFSVKVNRYAKSIVILLLLGCSLNLFGEGTRELLVNTTAVGSGLQFDTTKSTYTGLIPTNPANVVQIWDQGPSPGGLGRITGTFTSINPTNEKFRIKIRACNVGEVINFGFNPSNNNLMFWRLYKEDGTPIRFNGAGGALTNLSAIAGVETVSASIGGSGSLGPNDFTYRVPRNTESAQPGYIQWYSQAVVGPLPSCSTTVAVDQLGRGYIPRTYCGYTSIQYQVQPGDIGAKGFADFFIVFNGNDPVVEQKTVGRHLAMFDVSVWSDNVSVPRVTKKARLYSSAWDINCNGLSSPQQTFNSKLYFYSKDSVITSVTFNQMRPYGFIICANQTGCANTGNNAADRKSRIQFNGAPDYPVFLNNPFSAVVADRTCGIVPKGSFGNVTSASITGCDNDRCINLLVDRTGTVGITLIPPVPGTFVPRVFNNSTVIANTNTCIPWDGKDGAGNQITGTVTIQINYFNGLTNLPLFDVEEHPFGYVIDLIAPAPSVGAKPILVYWDDRPPASSATLDLTAGSARDGLWDNDNNPLTADVVVGFADGDPVNPNQSHSTYNLLGCDPLLDHSASTAGAQGCHLWSGRGLNTACPGTPNCAETHNTWWNANVVEITVPFTTSNVKVFSDLDAAPAPKGTGNTSSRTKNVCSTVNPIPINGTVIVDPSVTSLTDANDVTDDIFGTGRWSLIPLNASGSFGSAATNLTNTYIPVAADYTRGFVLLKVTSDSTAQTPCGTGNDTLRINLRPGPDVWARQNTTVCANNALVRLDPGIVGDSSGVNSLVTSFQWFPFVGAVPQVGGVFVPNNQSLGINATYTPPASFTSGTITMRIKSLSSSVPATFNCPADSAQFNIIVNTVPLVDAGNPLTICDIGAASSVTLSPTVGNPTITPFTVITDYSILWTGNGTFVNGNGLTPTYTPTAAERALGIAKIVFNVTKTSSPSCAPARDTLVITITPRPTANAGVPISRCKNNVAPISLNGTATNATSVLWSFVNNPVVGSGSFAPATNDTTVFTPSGTIPDTTFLTLTANKAGCPSATSTVKVTYTPAPSVDILDGVFYCVDNPSVVMSVTFGGPATTGEWFGNSQGTVKPLGTFTPNDTDPNATYTFAPSEVGSFAALYYISTGNGTCLATVDSTVIDVNPDPTITLPLPTDPASIRCSNNPQVILTGPFISGAVAAGSIKWTSLGTTQSFTSTTTENTTFTPSAADISVGFVKIVLEAKGITQAGVSCATVRDTMTITFTSAPTSSAGSNYNVCANNPTVNISGSVTPPAAGHTWSVSGGAPGTFGNAGNLTTTFTATGTPAVGSTTTLLLTATLAGCTNVPATATVTYTAPPTATITTAPGSVCKNNPVIILKGTSSTGALHWSSGSNCATCFTDTNAVAPDSTLYTPSAADLANPSNTITFTINTRNNGSCNAVNSSTVTFTFINSPTISLSPIPNVCENAATINLAGASATITPNLASVWTSSSGCVSCFSDPTDKNAIYIPSADDITNGTVTFTLTTTGALSNCVAVQRSVTATINKAPAIVDGPDLVVCKNQNTVALSGASSTNTSSVAWTVKAGAGTGTITNPSSISTAVYNITATDKTNGTAIVILTGNGIGGCAPVSQERVIQFTDLPSANAGPDYTICQNDAPALLDGSGSNGGTWTCVGCISAITNPTSLSATYNPAAGDINQTRTFTYAIPAGGGCPAVSDAVAIHFNPAPTVTITAAPVIQCGNDMTIDLTGAFTNATGLIWTSDGTGSFDNQTSLTPIYTLSAADTVGTNSTVVFTVMTTGSNPCSAVNATATVTIADPIVLNAGADQNRCGTVPGSFVLTPTALSGGATSVVWSIIGAASGSLAPTTATTATYTLGAGDAGTSVTFQGITNGVGLCPARTDQVVYTFIPGVVVSASSLSTAFCQTGSVTLDGTITNSNTGTWACTNCAGTGTFSPNNTHNNLIPQTSVQFSPSPADTSKTSLTFVLTSDAVNICGTVSSTPITINLEKKPTVNAGTANPICENNNVYTLNGSMTNSATGFWKSGANKFTGFASNNVFPTATTYDPDTVEVQNGFVTLTLYSSGSTVCPSDSDKVTLTFTKAPIVNAGLDRFICKNNPTFNLVGTINPAGGGFTTAWSSPNCGAPCFSAPTALATNYTLSYPADTTGTSLMLFLTATDPTGLCVPDRDTVVINLSQPPLVNITTLPMSVCSDSAFVNLAGTSTSGFNWSSNGTGTFQASAFLPSVVYPFTAADRAKANLPAPNNVIRIFLSSDNGLCLPVTDFVDITLAPAPIITITTGDSISICASQNTVNVQGSVNQPGYMIDWTTSGNGSFSVDPSASAQLSAYTLTALDKAAGAIILVGHTINPPGSSCRAATDQYKVLITPFPVVDAGANYTVCQTTSSLDLSDATVANTTTSVTWSTSGTGVFGVTNQTVGAGSVYYPSNIPGNPGNDIDAPFNVTLTLTAVGCSTVTDTRTITFTPKPTAAAGVDQTICNEANSVSITGTATNANSVSWKVSGAAGTFANTAAATYSPTVAEKAAGFVNLVFTANGNGNCTPITDTLRVTIRPQPTIAIGPDVSFCSKTIAEVLQYSFPTITLTNGLTATWAATGTGLDAFDPTKPTYSITNADILNGSVTIIASTRSNAACMLVQDAMVINITKAPTLTIGPDINTCAGSGATIQLNSSSTNSLGTPSWSSDKAGIFDNPNITTPVYDPDPLEEVNPLTTTIVALINGTGSCPPAYDTLRINFTSSPTLADLQDTVICFTSGVPINYAVSSGLIGDWTTTSGAFSAPGGTGQSSVTLQFTPAAPTTITITFDPSNACFNASVPPIVNALITFVTSPTVTVTSPLDICVNNKVPLNLASTPANNGAVSWSTIQGFGSIAAPGSANTTYTVNADSSDFALDSIMVKVTVQGTNPSCAPAEDTVVIFPHQAPLLSAADQIVCSDLLGDPLEFVTLNGTIRGSGQTSTTWSSGELANIGNPAALTTTANIVPPAFPATVTLTANGLHTSCTAVTATMTINQQLAPTFTTAGLDISGCSNGSTVNLNAAAINPSVPGGAWSSPGTGSFSPNNIGATGISYSPSAADLLAGNINLTYAITDTGVCYKGYTDVINVVFNTPFKINTTTPIFTFCAQDNNVNLTSLITPVGVLPGTSSIAWTKPSGMVPGGGVFTSATNTLNATYDPNPSNVPNGGDVANGGAILQVKLVLGNGCPDDSDLVSLLLVPEPAAIVNAGVSQQVCVDRTDIQLQGLILNAAGGIWRTSKYPTIKDATVGASGDFSDSLDLEAKYIIAAADRLKPVIRLYLYSNGGNSLCSQVIDSIDITFTPRPVPSANAVATSVCADVDSIELIGGFTMGGINGIWSSSGDGVFTNIGVFDSTPIYIPGPADINVGKVKFTYSSNNFQDCQAYSAIDSTIITPKIVANAGPDLVVCANNTTGITITASSPPTNTGIWTMIGVNDVDYDGTFTQINSLQATYIPGDTVDPNVAAVGLKFVSTGGAPCRADSSQMVIQIAPSPSVSIATNTQTVCNDISSIDVNVTDIQVATGGFWTSTGTGSFTDATALSTAYNFSASDLDSTNITIAFITTGNVSNTSLCNPAADALTITLTPKPVVAAIAAYNCVTPIGVSLDNSTVTYGNPGASGVWTTNFPATQGQFSLDEFMTNASPNTSYFPSQADITRGTVTLRLTSAGAGTCNPITRSITLNVSNTPIADAGPDLFVCTGSDVALKATPFATLVGYDWADVPTPGSLVIPSGLQTEAGPINALTRIELTVTDNRGCTNKDTVAVNAVDNPNITQAIQQCYDFYGYVDINPALPVFPAPGSVSPLGGFQWYYNGSLMSGETADSVRVTQPGTYIVAYSLGACTDSSLNSTRVLDLPRILTPDFIGCKNSFVNANVDSIPNIDLASMNLPYNYTWTSVPNPGPFNGNPVVLPTSIVNPLVVDTIKYAVTASYTTSLPLTCTYTDTVRVISIPRPQPALIDSAQACAGTPITLDANTPPSNLPALTAFNQVINWYVESDSTVILDTDAIFTTLTTNNYVVRVTIGQCVGKDTAVVNLRPYPTKVLPDEVKQCFETAGSAILITADGSVSDPGFTGVNYQWFSDGSLITGQTTKNLTVTYPMIKDETDEELIIISSVVNHFGILDCPITDTVKVKDVCVPRIFPPTAFHPGDPNSEDGFFTIKGKYYTNFKITVYSRWGEVIFYTEDPNENWDGRYRGDLMPVGVYAYIITYEGKDELTKGPFKKEGRIVLVR